MSDYLAVHERYISEEEYLEREEKSVTKNEYFNGRIYPMQPPLDGADKLVAMSGGTNLHARLGLQAGSSLINNLRGKSCRAVGSDQQIRIEASGIRTYPDVAAYPKGARFADEKGVALLEPRVVIEVLSPSMAAYDRGDKFDQYKLIPTLRDYLLVAQDRVRVEHFSRSENGWLMRVFIERDDIISLASVDAQLALAEVYDDIEVPSGALPPPTFTEN